MKIGIMQPYFLPYIGYFQLINAVDKFVIHDDVQYIKGGWINRNRTLLNSEKYNMTLRVKNDSYKLNINERYFVDDCQKDFNSIKKGIELTYRKARYYDDVSEVINKILSYDTSKNISEFITNSLCEVCDYLDIKTDIILSSKLEKNNDLSGEERVIEIVKVLDGDWYINPIGGTELYSKDNFKEKDIKLNFIKTRDIKYKQFAKSFEPNLSMLDVLMFNSKDEINKLLNEYELI